MTVPRFWREQPQRYRLVASECASCKRVDFPPRVVCPDCRRESVGHMNPRDLVGRGNILSWTTVHQAAADFDLQVPYVIALVQLEEGCRVMGQIVDLNGTEPRTGLAVEACFRRVREDGKSGIIYYGYKFRVARPAAPRPPAAGSKPRLHRTAPAKKVRRGA